MAWDGTGTYNRPVTTVSPATDGTTIDPGDQNTYTADTAEGINAALAKNGENIGASFLADRPISDMVYVNNSNDNPNISDTSLTVTTALTKAAWESVGPTSPGTADVTWTALDGVPTDINWVRVRIYGNLTGTALKLEGKLYARATGGTQSASGLDNTIWLGEMQTGTTDSKDFTAMCEAVIPVNSDLAFDLYWTEVVVASADYRITLIGYGWNGTWL